jgi:short-subunit dehydrogenase
MDAKAIVITGASSGIGAALAWRLSEPGRILGLIGRHAERLAAVVAACAESGGLCRIACIDVRDLGQLSEFLERFDEEEPIDLLVANAGVLDGRRADQILETGVVARQVVETSLAAFAPRADAPAYSDSKAGLLSYGLALREAVASEDIKVVVACPGFVATAVADVHLGPRPGEISEDDAAARILNGFERNRALNGFPLLPFWLSRIGFLVPEFVRLRGSRRMPFHVGSSRSSKDMA